MPVGLEPNNDIKQTRFSNNLAKSAHWSSPYKVPISGVETLDKCLDIDYMKPPSKFGNTM